MMNRRRALMSVVSSGPAPAHGTWQDLFDRIADGTYATAYSVGEILPLDLGTEGEVNAQIVAFNTDNKSDNSGKAKVSFVAQYLLKTSKRYNPAVSGSTVGTGIIGGWENCELRAYLRDTILPLFPSIVSNRIVAVKKYTCGYENGATNKNMLSNETIWSPSYREMSDATTFETSGIQYSLLKNATARTKKKATETSAIQWWSRSGANSGNTNAIAPTSAGSIISNYSKAVSNSRGVCIGFCID